MEDRQIIDMYWRRDETAIAETERKYGGYCYAIAMNMLSVHEDAESCVSDTYYRAWNSIPPHRPAKFRVWLGRIVRNISINLWHSNHAQKRYSGMDRLLSELEDCVPSQITVEDEIEDAELGACISGWLMSLDSEDRNLFVRRYWNGEALNVLGKETDTDPKKLAQHMYRLRLSLKSALEKEGISL